MTREELIAEITRLKQMLFENAQDWADTDTECRQQAARVLDMKVVYGDSDGVPTIGDLCELMADEIARLVALSLMKNPGIDR